MKISVVTISFNQADFLRECIDSVLGQNYSNLEYIIVDPGSTDGSRDIIESYGDRIIRVFEKDNGPAEGLNNGFSVAKGDICCFINSDDFLLSGALRRVGEFFINNKDVDVFLGGGFLVNENGFVIKNIYPSLPTPKMYVNGAVTFFQQGMFIRSHLLKKINFNIHNKSCWDGEFLLDLMLNDVKIFRSMEFLAAFRVYPQSITGSQRFKNLYDNDQNRMFSSIYHGNLRNKKYYKYFYRILKLIYDPKYFFMRIYSMLIKNY